MGRVSRYKKIKSIDPFAKNGSWKSDVGDCSTLRRARRTSKTVLRLKEQKASKSRRGKRKAGDEERKTTGGCNGWGDDAGYDLPPAGGDEFDANDMLGSVKKQTLPPPPQAAAPSAAAGAPGDEKWTRKVGRVDARGVAGAEGRAPSSQHGCKDTPKKLLITAKTPTKEIIAACSHPTSNRGTTAEASSSKQEKRKAFLDRKKWKKRNRGNGAWNNEEDDEDARQRALPAQQSAPAKKHLAQQNNYSSTLVARTAMDEQVERPPTFTSLPRGAHKLAKNKITAQSTKNGKGGARSTKEEDDGEKAQRIRKEQLALEAMRQQVMKQYAVLRERRRQDSR